MGNLLNSGGGNNGVLKHMLPVTCYLLPVTCYLLPVESAINLGFRRGSVGCEDAASPAPWPVLLETGIGSESS